MVMLQRMIGHTKPYYTLKADLFVVKKNPLEYIGNIYHPHE